jgi:hypothetical protein
LHGAIVAHAAEDPQPKKKTAGLRPPSEGTCVLSDLRT